jgi:hypothetical protein
MVFHSLGKFQGTVYPEKFLLVSYCAPGGFGRDRIARCREFFVDGDTQTVVAKRWHCSQSAVRHDCISLLAYWALDAEAFGELRKKPVAGGRHGVPPSDCDT